ncbi:hypothetical protein [Shinella zoogloeoides]|uniref:hypothetical protein n=1 Tax=Shinella zoogloeoides TaxID=352475 RepID=UPI00299DA44B|nr:hypothetical protein [Shinella zoogloeoides]WPE23935.1 hypothetical protein ShzoTeo12_51550 [Shinella zoogloeoides]
MRSTLKTITVATFVLSLAAGGALAANPSSHHEGHHPGTPSMNDTRPGMPLMVRHVRLDRVLGELGSAQQSIRQDEAMHRLSASAYRRLEGEVGAIRSRAMTVADMHGGGLPRASYQHLQQDIHKLDRDIVRMS